MRILALDFDGVISDSAPESFAIALRTWAGLRPNSSLAAQAAGLAGPRAPALEAVRGAPAYPSFLALMPLGNRAEDYAVVLGAIESGRELADQGAYDAFRREWDPGWLDDYHRRFYAERDSLAAGDPEGWQGLMAPYAPVVALLRRRKADVELAIATSKDRRSVAALLRRYGIADLFAGDRILDKEAGRSKRAHVSEIARRAGLDPAAITFLDDKVNHLDGVAALGARCGLAAWGYNGLREIQLARKRGYLVCTLADAEGQIFGGSGAAEVGPVR